MNLLEEFKEHPQWGRAVQSLVSVDLSDQSEIAAAFLAYESRIAALEDNRWSANAKAIQVQCIYTNDISTMQSTGWRLKGACLIDLNDPANLNTGPNGPLAKKLKGALKVNIVGGDFVYQVDSKYFENGCRIAYCGPEKRFPLWDCPERESVDLDSGGYK